MKNRNTDLSPAEMLALQEENDDRQFEALVDEAYSLFDEKLGTLRAFLIRTFGLEVADVIASKKVMPVALLDQLTVVRSDLIHFITRTNGKPLNDAQRLLKQFDRECHGISPNETPARRTIKPTTDEDLTRAIGSLEQEKITSMGKLVFEHRIKTYRRSVASPRSSDGMAPMKPGQGLANSGKGYMPR